jgi:hypothetical protein
LRWADEFSDFIQISLIFEFPADEAGYEVLVEVFDHFGGADAVFAGFEPCGGR